MSTTRDGFYFEYSDAATPEFINELKNIINFYDGFTDTKTYAPIAAGIASLTIAAVQFGLGNSASYSTVFNVLLVLVPALQVGTMALATAGINNFAAKGNRLIDKGVNLKFFKDAPDKLPTTEVNNEAVGFNTNQPNIQADAIKHHFGLGRR